MMPGRFAGNLPADAFALYCLALPLVLAVCGCVDQGAGPQGNAQVAGAHLPRRAYAGAPPVIPHGHLSGRCVYCHNETGGDIPTLGFAPANPHQATTGLSADSRCVQCHAFQQIQEEFRASTFIAMGAPVVGKPYHRADPFAPPTIPHPLFMREACITCHSATPAKRTPPCTHTDRIRCVQCHAANAEVRAGPTSFPP